MDWLIDAYRQELLVFACVLARVAGLTLAAPLFAARTLPGHVRVIVALALAAIISPVHWQASIASPGGAGDFLVSTACEGALGIAFGTAVGVLLAGARLAGQTISNMVGLSFGGSVDDEGATLPAFGRLLDLVAIAVFLTMGGHRQVIAALLDTFQWLPPGSARFSAEWIDGLTAVVTQSFTLGLRIAAPVVVSLLLAHLAVAFVSRTVPQIQALGIGFSLNSLVALATLSLSLGAIVWVFQDQLEATLTMIQATLTGSVAGGERLLDR